MSEQASERNAGWMSARRSCRMRNRRKRCSHPKVRSTTHRHRPSLSRDSTPYRAIRAAMPRRHSQTRCAREAYARSACSLPGRLRARPESKVVWSATGPDVTSCEMDWTETAARRDRAEARFPARNLFAAMQDAKTEAGNGESPPEAGFRLRFA